jgi:hypothetical protein
MSDIDLEKFRFDQQYSNNLWEDLFGITSTLIFDNQNPQISVSSSSSSSNKNSWESFKAYTTIPKTHGFNDEQTGYCRLDRDGHWLLLSTPPLLHNDEKKRSSTNSISQQTEPTFLDSCESLTVSLEFHVPTDELITDIDEQKMVVWGNKIQQYRNTLSDETSRISR